MRRQGRNLREQRNSLIRRRSQSVIDKRQKAKEKIIKQNQERQQAFRELTPQEKREHRQRLYRRHQGKMLRRPPSKVKIHSPDDLSDYKNHPAYSKSEFDGFKTFNEYEYSSRPVRICHLIDSLGLGGAQTMMMELVNGLNNHYKEHIHNSVLIVHQKPQSGSTLWASYGVRPKHIKHEDFKEYCKNNNIDIIVHHRTSLAKCIKKYIPEGIKYILVNHTWNYLVKMRDFQGCDYYISVCKFLQSKTKWQEYIHKSRRLSILNGVENDYLKDIEPAELEGSFKTGRCHRMVLSKFRPDSLRWLSGQVSRTIPGITHHLLGTSKAAKEICRKNSRLYYYGSINDRIRKMSIIKALDVYFYETFQSEGASMAILESLACGIPVLCRPMGGNSELVHNGINGFLVGDRSEFLDRMIWLASPKNLASMKEKALDDFDKRLHIKHTACKYMQLFEHILKHESNSNN